MVEQLGLVDKRSPASVVRQNRLDSTNGTVKSVVQLALTGSDPVITIWIGDKL